jgi:two-component system chemotaxis response regulator CheY
MHVLIVDDSTTMRKVLGSYLRELGIQQADEAADGKEAIELANQRAYDLVLLDWNMPKMTGIEVLKTLRARGSKVPVIMVTTDAERMKVVEAIKCGANNYLMKPVVKEKFLEVVRNILHLPA